MREISPDESLHARYAERVPDAPDYFETHDFSYWKMDLTRVRYIAGFGRISWVAAEAVRRDPRGVGVGEAAAEAIAHMNADHAEALLAMCEAFRGFRPEAARIAELDRTGFLVRTRGPERLLHFSFEREARAADLREIFVGLTRKARERLGRSSTG
jgi:putative heme iron utilization protein